MFPATVVSPKEPFASLLHSSMGDGSDGEEDCAFGDEGERDGVSDIFSEGEGEIDGVLDITLEGEGERLDGILEGE